MRGRRPKQISPYRNRAIRQTFSERWVGSPFSFGTVVDIKFWMESEKVNTKGVVRASDPGVGMGIEFTGLDYESQERFQRMLETLEITCAPKKDPESAANTS